MTALGELSIPFCVAPFEADAQLAYLCRVGWVHAVITEDSDLLAYGCPNTIFKMDRNGNGDNIVLPCLQVDVVPPAIPQFALEEEALAAADDAEAVVPAGRGSSRGRGRGKRGRGGRARGA